MEVKTVTIQLAPEERQAARQFFAMMGCKCSEEEYTFGSYPEDGECDCGIHKHHVHCGTCGEVRQIG